MKTSQQIEPVHKPDYARKRFERNMECYLICIFKPIVRKYYAYITYVVLNKINKQN